MEKKHEIQDLKQMQALPLKMKIKLTQSRIRQWVNEFGEDGVYVAFSGGKDSTVLLDIVRKMYPSIKAVYVDTGLEYPEIKQFVKGFDDVEIIRPEMVFKDVITKYGYPMITKEASESIYGAKKYLTELLAQKDNSTDRQTDRQTDSCRTGIHMKSLQQQGNIPGREELAKILNQRMVNREGGSNRRLAIMLGMLSRDKEHPIQANIPSKDRSEFSQKRYAFTLNAPFIISNKCCTWMKKRPAHDYNKKYKCYPITAQMAAESRLRTQKWLQNGCNGFDMKNPISNPMSFWTEQDVLLYIKQNNLELCSVYGDIVEDLTGTEEVEGQLTISDLEGFEDMGLFDAKRLPLKTTGANRTGCMFCGFGAHLDKGLGRYERLAQTHPKICDYVLRGGAFDENGLWKPDSKGLGYWFVLQWINIHGNFNIAIPDYKHYEQKYGTKLTEKHLQKG